MSGPVNRIAVAEVDGWWPRLGAGVLAIAALWWAARGAQVSFGELGKGLPWIGDFLSRMGCRYGQGHLFGRAQPLAFWMQGR